MKSKLFITFIVLVSFFLVSCDYLDTTDTNKESKIEIIFYGYDEEVYAKIDISKDDLVLPEQPSVEGHIFSGWYLDKNFWNQQFDIETIMIDQLEESIYVYSRWDKVHPVEFLKEHSINMSREFVELSLIEDTIYATYKVGSAINVYLDQMYDVVENSIGNASISVDSGVVNESSISTSISTSLGYTIGVDAFVKVEASINVEFGLETSQSISNSLSHEVSFDLSDEEKGKFYAIAVMGSYDVYQVFEKNLVTGEEKSYPKIKVVGTSYFKVVKSSTNDFSYLINNSDHFYDSFEETNIFSVGNGTVEAPYEINNETQFLALFFNLDKNYRLMNDIEFKTYEGIAYGDFSGSFDGNNHKINNLTITIQQGSRNVEENYGLFSIVSGNIHNLYIFDSHLILPIGDNNHDGDGYVNGGLIAGKSTASAVFHNIHVYNSSLKMYRDDSTIGTISGSSEGTFNNCQVYNTYVFGNGDVGGIVGSLKNGLITNSIFSGTSDDSVINYGIIDMYSNETRRSSGGLVGYCSDSTIEYSTVSYVKFIMRGNDNYEPCQGYIVGHFNNGTITGVAWENNLKDDQMDNWKNGFLNTGSSKDNYFPAKHEYAGLLTGKNNIS